jgi:RNA polymerase sigma-70 factor (ECF subfamily)
VEDPASDELLRRVAGGDATALADLYDQHAGWLLLRLQRRCADPGLAEEVLQDVFVSVWRSASSYRAGSAGGWLWTIASRRLVEGLRRAGRVPALAEQREQVSPGVDEVVLSELAYGDLSSALARLSPELRAVLQATVLDGFSTREASVVLGIPVGTVKTRAARARAELRAGLA